MAKKLHETRVLPQHLPGTAFPASAFHLSYICNTHHLQLLKIARRVDRAFYIGQPLPYPNKFKRYIWLYVEDLVSLEYRDKFSVTRYIPEACRNIQLIMHTSDQVSRSKVDSRYISTIRTNKMAPYLYERSKSHAFQTPRDQQKFIFLRSTLLEKPVRSSHRRKSLFSFPFSLRQRKPRKTTT